MADRLEVKGLRETIRTLEKFGVQVADLKASFKRIGNIVVNEARTLAPKKSGKLLGTIKASNTKNKSIVRAGGARVPYAGVIHYGGYHNIEPHPFLTNALQANQSKVVQELDREIHGLIRGAGLNK